MHTLFSIVPKVEEKPSNLSGVLERHRGEKHIIVLQDYPDPDAIASALAHRLISRRFEINTDIVYGGQISHQQNRALVKFINTPLLLARDDFDVSSYQGSILIDSQGLNSVIMPHLVEKNIPLIAIVDHHNPHGPAPSAEFVDIRHVGATSTIYTAYLAQGMAQLDRSHREHVIIATALMHGIMTDTDQFIRATEEDFTAATYLSQFHDSTSLLEIMKQARSRQTMDIIQLALRNRTLRENYAIAGIGYVRAADRDAIPQAADFMLTEENVHTAIVYGIVFGEHEGQRTESVIGSLRTTKLTLDPDQFIKEAFGRNERGQFFGGGRLEAGGFEIPIGFLVGNQDPEYEKLKWQVYDLQLRRKLFAKLGIK
ncbi:MAG: bifunctional oligoribonuclease/PAP phosphatase NrnA [Chloroflexi bacterium]|nr:bifunctional oligoribonuclease/PAP phosphatase NrnA [Chloroflexota bacterium]